MNSAFYGVWKSGMIAGCKHTAACGTPTAFPASDQRQRYRASSVTRKARVIHLCRREKNGMRSLRTWNLFWVGAVLAVLAAIMLTILIPRPYPFQIDGAKTAA